MNEQEHAWLERARAGEHAAFGLLVETYQRPVLALTYRMLGDLSEAEDAAQEAFLRAYSRLHQYDPSHKFSTWLFSIANNHCIDRLRKRRVQFVGLDDSPAVYTLEGETSRPEQEALAAEQAEEMHALVNQLEPEYRTPLVLRYWNECSYQEIADVMQISVAAVKSRLFRARKQLAALYVEAQQPQRVERTPTDPDLKRRTNQSRADTEDDAVQRFDTDGNRTESGEGWAAALPLLFAPSGRAGL